MKNEMAMVLRTTDLYNLSKSLEILDSKEKLIKICNKYLIFFLANNKDIDLYIIIDSKNENYIKLINEIYSKHATIIEKYSGSNSASFSYQIEFSKTLSNKYKYLYIGEDDYLFLGKINFQELNAYDEDTIFTNYNHPDYQKPIRKFLRKIDNGNYHTLCMSFFLKSNNLLNIEYLLLKFNLFSDGEVWALNFKPFIFYLWILKNIFNKKIEKKKLIKQYINLKKDKKLKSFNIILVKNSESIQLSNDGLPLKYSFINSFKKTEQLNYFLNT